MTGPTSINPLLVITNNVPERIKELRDERDRLVRRVLEINQELARLETMLVLSEPAKPREGGASEPGPRVRDSIGLEYVAAEPRRAGAA